MCVTHEIKFLQSDTKTVRFVETEFNGKRML